MTSNSFTYSPSPKRKSGLGFWFSLTTYQRRALSFVFLAYVVVVVKFSQRSISASHSCEVREQHRILLDDQVNKCIQKVESLNVKQENNDTGTSSQGTRTERSLIDKEGRGDDAEEVEEERPLPDYPDCTKVESFSTFMRYEPHKPCPDDWPLAQKLLLEEQCHSFCIPRRNCFSRNPSNFLELPRGTEDFRWKIPEDQNIDWSQYDCKSFACLNNRTSGDCRECFQLDNEARRWVVERKGKLTLQSVIALKPAGSIRLALDVGGGSGSFAARLADYNVTVVTTGINSGAPFLETMAQRGLLGLHLSHTARLPMFDHAMDMIHSMHSVQYLPTEKFQLMVMDWDRVLRPGGLMWLEFLYLPPEKMDGYEKVFKGLGYKEHEWYMEETSNDSGPMKRLSVVLEKSKVVRA